VRRALPGPALLVLVLAGGCGGAPIPPPDLAMLVAADAGEVAPGRAFGLTVTRRWRRDLVPAEFDEAALRPLALRLERLGRRDDGRRVEETRRYRAYAFTRSDVGIRPVTLRALAADGSEAVVEAEGLRLRVSPALEAGSPGPAEIPSDRPPRPPPLWPVAAGFLLALAFVALARRARDEARREPAPATPAARALERLERLRASPDALLVAAVLRDWLSEARGVPARVLTTEEVASAPLGDARLRQGVVALLELADRAKYAALPATAAEAAAARECAESLLRVAVP
jgi:hypothetical protein